MSAAAFMCLMVGIIAAISEVWGVVIFCLVLGSCAG